MQPDVRHEIVGRWPGVLAALGVPERVLSGKHGPCPNCGGRDRFRFDDKEGRGTWICSKCGAGDGFKLVMSMRGIDFREAVKVVREVLPRAPEVKAARERSTEEKRQALRRVWDQAQPITPGDSVHHYLATRGISRVPDALRYVPRMGYYRDGRKVGSYDAMVAVVWAADGRGLSLHVTYLQDGQKAPVEAPRKVMQPVSTIAGGAVRLDPPAEVLGVAEGIETALAAHELFGLPVWATVNANGLESFLWPASVRRIVIFGDNDASFTGHKAAYTLAFRARAKGLDVEVRCPDRVDEDWNDVLRDPVRARAVAEVEL